MTYKPTLLALLLLVGCASPLCYVDIDHGNDHTNYLHVDSGMLCGSYYRNHRENTYWAQTDTHWGGRTFATEETAKAFVENDCHVGGIK